jgi:predicted MFS family arabinose efflux permease
VVVVDKDAAGIGGWCYDRLYLLRIFLFIAFVIFLAFIAFVVFLAVLVLALIVVFVIFPVLIPSLFQTFNSTKKSYRVCTVQKLSITVHRREKQ